MNDNQYINPPGASYDVIDHPSGRQEAIEIALMREHRFAFFYWFKWWKKANFSLPNSKAPSLISIDWHRDLCAPSESEMHDLQHLSLRSYKESTLFCWDKLNPNNDGHILAAAYLNLIGDIYVLCKQDNGAVEPIFVDRYGNDHLVKCFETSSDLYDELCTVDISKIYFDIDLDYFVESNAPCGGGSVTLKREAITAILNPDSSLMIWLFQRMEGMTIATEPEFCGGLSNSNKIFCSLDTALFRSSLFSHTVTWLHLNQ